MILICILHNFYNDLSLKWSIQSPDLATIWVLPWDFIICYSDLWNYAAAVLHLYLQTTKPTLASVFVSKIAGR